MLLSTSSSVGLLRLVMLLVVLVVFAQNATAQEDASNELPRTQIQEMNTLQDSIDAKLEARDAIRASITSAAADDIPDLQIALDETNTDIKELRSSFEQLAIGTVDIGVFEEESSSVDWRTEVSQLLLPVMQNLKRITEKPRKVEALRTAISTASEQKRVTMVALAGIEQSQSQVTDAKSTVALSALKETWADRLQDLDREINLATLQLENLQRNDTSFFKRVWGALVDFLTGRGLTIFIAVVVGFIAWYATKLLARISSKRVQGENTKSFKTRQRIVHYAFKALAVLLILIVVMVVFYVRGDLLLMGLMFLVTAAVVLGLRNTIPQFLSETRLLLNLGSIREDERVMYQGLPWKVISLNIHSVLRNPELTGVIRLPLKEMLGLISRPAGKESWFPASKNDYILMSDGRVLNVTSITPEHVSLENLAQTKTTVPTADFYNLTFDNLSRSDTFFVSSAFGIGYSHQSESVEKIPAILKAALEKSLANSSVNNDVVGVYVELKEAGASSLDYFVGVSMKSSGAASYFKVSRLIQQACVATCTEQNWDIPFPQLTLHSEQS